MSSQSIVTTGLRGSGHKSILEELKVNLLPEGGALSSSRLGTTDLSILDLVSVEVEECSQYINANYNITALIYVLDLGDDYIHTLAILHKIMKEIKNPIQIDVLLHKCDRIPIKQERQELLRQISDRFPPTGNGRPPTFHLSSIVPDEKDPKENVNWIVSKIVLRILKNSYNISTKKSSFLLQQTPRICLASWGVDIPSASEFVEASSLIDMMEDVKGVFDFVSLGSGKIGQIDLADGGRISYSHFMGSILFTIFK